MSQVRAVRSRNNPRSRSTTPPLLQPSNLALMELKQRILVGLSKLGDRDTQQMGMVDLHRIAESLPLEALSIFLSCLYEAHKEAVRLFGTLALSPIGDSLIPHLGKIMANIMRRLRDPDSGARDACADALAALSERLLFSSTLASFVKPLLDGLLEQNKTIQVGAAICLCRVIEAPKNPPVGALQKLCPKLRKVLGIPTFLAKAALLPVIGSLGQAGVLNHHYLTMLLPCLNESLASNDWATRKAAADTLARLTSTSQALALADFKSSTLLVLESCKFDKVKPVRESIHEATNLWKNLQGPDENLSGGEISESDISEGQGMADAHEVHDEFQPSVTNNIDTESQASPGAEDSKPNAEDDAIQTPAFSVEKVVSASKKRTERRINPGFFQKLDKRASDDDWQVKVSVPRSIPPLPPPKKGSGAGLESPSNLALDEALSVKAKVKVKGALDSSRSSPIQSLANGNDGSSSHGYQTSVGGYDNPDECADTKELLIIDDRMMDAVPVSQFSRSPRKEESFGIVGDDDVGIIGRQSLEGGDHLYDTSSSKGCSADSQSGNGKWLFICQQLSQLEQQQSRIMEMLQEFMGTSQDNMSSLETRVCGLEKTVEDMLSDFSVSRNNRNTEPYRAKSIQSTMEYTSSSDPVNSSELKTEGSGISDAMMNERGSHWVTTEARGGGDWECFSRISSGEGFALVYSGENEFGGTRMENNNTWATEDDQSSFGRDWERDARIMRVVGEEGPSARGVWQASKDEATLAAIRVAKEEEEEGIGKEATPTMVAYRSQGGCGKGPFGRLWSHAMESVRAGDVESAYAEMLRRSEDEMMVVQLMCRTGPVLERLSPSTLRNALLSAGQLVRQPSFFDFGLPWIQQAAEMVEGNGVECLGLSDDDKMEILISLQEASTMDLPKGWASNGVQQLLERLANMWSIDPEQLVQDI